MGLIFLNSACFAACLLETKDFALSMDMYFRQEVVTFKNVVDLDSGNSDDSSTYLGIDYHLGFRSEFKNNDAVLYLKLERNGPWDYDAPLFTHNTLMTSGGVIEEYRNDELLPQLEEFWLDAPLWRDFRFKIGLYTYEVGNGFSLNGSFENYGFSIFRDQDNSAFRFYYCRPDVVYKNRLGPRIRQDEEQGIDYNHNSANFFAADARFNFAGHCLKPYLGVLADYTSPEKRDNSFAAPIKKDLLGTAGCAWNFTKDGLSLDLELARNFGKGESEDSSFEDVYHTGYLAYAKAAYQLKRFKPALQFLFGSGNKASLEAAQNPDNVLVSGKNRAFSYFSPLNNNLSDSINGCHVDIRPVVAMGSGFGLNYGIPRPQDFSASDFDNIIIACTGFDFGLNERLTIGLYGYYLRAVERGVATLNSEAKYLPRELGYETDLFIDYRVNQNTLVSLLGGYYFPGRYYREERDDTQGSLLNPFVRGDGRVDPAFQIEFVVEFNF